MAAKKNKSTPKVKPTESHKKFQTKENEIEIERSNRLMGAISRLEIILNRYRLEQFYEVEQFKKTPYKMIWINLILGIARGVGFILGISVIGAVVLSILAKLLSGMLEIPMLGQLVAEIVQSAKQYLENGKP